MKPRIFRITSQRDTINTPRINYALLLYIINFGKAISVVPMCSFVRSNMIIIVCHIFYFIVKLYIIQKDCRAVSFPKNALGISPNTGVTSLLLTLSRSLEEEGTSTHQDSDFESNVECISVTTVCMHDAKHLKL